jgi:hypothetical protein
MDLCERPCHLVRLFCVSLTLAAVPVGPSIADDRIEPFRGRVVATRSQQVCANPVTSTLGTFEPTPYLMVRGNWPTGGGYSPLEVYGDQTMALYGPLSPLRAVSAPVRIYARGYDGRIYPSEGTSFSNPNLPRLSPVIYPTPASYYYGPRVNRTPPWWSSGTNWIDQQ